MPVDLQQRHQNGESDLSPYSDRQARDLLLVEMLCFDADAPPEDCVSTWNWEFIERRLKAVGLETPQHYLLRREILDRPEQQRATSRELATAMKVNQPPMKIINSNRHAGVNHASESVTSKVSLRLRDVLWSISIALWFLLGLTVQEWVKQQCSSDGLQNSTAAWIAGMVTFSLGGWWTSRTAYGAETPTVLQIGPFHVKFPACKTDLESATARRAVALVRLAIGTTLLSVAARLL